MTDLQWLNRPKARNPVLSDELWELVVREKHALNLTASGILEECLRHYLVTPLSQPRPAFRVPSPKKRRGISLDDELWLQLKLRAAMEGRSMSDVIEEAYRRFNNLGLE